MMRIGSLFSGIGGLDLGVEVACARFGIPADTLWQVEIDDFCRTILARHWPHADRSIQDVRDGKLATLAFVDVIVGGFPCQDVSASGKGVGLAIGTRSGLWYEYLRIVDDLRPTGVIVENVASGAARWLCQVRSDLHSIGYRTRALAISAADVGAPQLRKRIFVIALADTDGQRRRADQLSDPRPRSGFPWRSAPLWAARQQDIASRPAAENSGVARRRNIMAAEQLRYYAPHLWYAPQSGMGGNAYGIPAGLDGHWPAGRGEEQYAWEPPRTTNAGGRARLKSLGNAVVPACAALAMSALLQWAES